MANDSDAFSIQLLDEAKRFLEKATAASQKDAFLHAALVLAFSALESHLNGIADELTLRQDMTVFDEAVLSERGVQLKGGEWKLTPAIRYYRLDDRIAFVFRRYAQQDVGAATWWSTLMDASASRNALAHPRDAVTLTVSDVSRYLSSIVEALNDLYMAVFGRGHPAHGRGLHSTLTF